MDTNTNTNNTMITVHKSFVELATGSPTGGVYAENDKHWSKNQQVNHHVGLLTVIFANEILFDNLEIIEQSHIDCCKQIVEDGVTVPMPMANEPSSTDGSFTKLAGIATTGEAVARNVTVPGCYHIATPDTEYVGQSRHLGGRVRNHEMLSRRAAKKGAAPHWLDGQAKNSTVTLFVLPDADKDGLYNGLSLKQILALLELYLFCLIRPRANRTYIPDSGPLNSVESNKIHSDRMASKVYVYDITGDKSILAYRHLGQLQLCHALGVSRTWISSLKIRTNGVFKKKFLFTTDVADDFSTPTMTLEQLKAFVQQNTLFQTKLQKKISNSKDPLCLPFPSCPYCPHRLV